MGKVMFLTNSEEELMNLLWDQEKALTSVEMKELSADKEWNQEYILNMLRSMKKKGFVEVCGSVQYHTQYARLFRPTITREGYAVKLALSTQGFDKHSFKKMAVMLAEEMNDDKEAVIKELEDIIQEMKEKDG